MNSNRKEFRIDGGQKELRDPALPKEIQIEKDVPTTSEILVGTESATERRDAAALLLAVAAIASTEIRVNGVDWDDDDQPTLVRPKASFAKPSAFGNKTRKRAKLAPRFATTKYLGNDSDQELEMEDLTLPPADDRFAWSRARAVSMDSEGNRGSPDSHRKVSAFGNIVSPESSPVSRRTPAGRKRGLRPKKRKRSSSVESVDSSHPTKKTLPNDKHKGRQMTMILRKKFSWKNYPELEAFLIANRDEYLRHSALNYTVQQKQYNNRLTERLLELAAEQGYVFDPEDFSFVTVRDRIRCYFKSFVQSAKKRGVIIGYAARKAGLLTEEDLEKSAGIAGRIVLPSSSS